MSKIQSILSRSLMALGACAAVAAQAAPTIAFDAFNPTTATSTGTYTENGFQLSGNALTVVGATWHPSYSTGSNSMLSNSANGQITLSKVGGGAFAFNAIDVSELYNQTGLNPTNVHFVAQLSGGGTADYVFDLDLVFGYQTVNFGSLFASVTSVSWLQTNNYHQFDNLVMDASTNNLPEPASLALAALALGGVGLVSRRKAAKSA